MSNESIISRLKLIFSEEELSRISFEERDGQNVILADVHGMKCSAANRFIHNIIAMIKAAFELIVIHGFHNGHAIRDMLRTGFSSSRVCFIVPEECNDGRTILICES